MSLPTDDEMTAAISRIGETSDGWLLRRYLQLIVNQICTDVGALPTHEGMRIVARKLATLLDANLARTATLDRPGDTDEPVIRSPAEPLSSSGPRGVARRVVPYPESGSGSGTKS